VPAIAPESSWLTHWGVQLGIGAAVATTAWLLGARIIAIVAVSVGAVVALLRFVAPAVHGKFAAGMAALGRGAASLVSHAITLVMFGIVIWPLGVLRFLRRRRRIPRGADDSVASYWVRARVPRPALQSWQFSMGPARVHRVASSIWVLVLVPLAVFGLNFAVGIELNDMGHETWRTWTGDRHTASTEQTPDYDALIDERADARTGALVSAIGEFVMSYDGKLLSAKDGERPSYQPTTLQDQPPIDVYFFGGSEMWGYGQRDLHTLASEYTRFAEQAGYRVRAHNYGRSAWVNWQEVAQFAQLLSSGRRPQVAIFLTGANDSAAYAVAKTNPLFKRELQIPFALGGIEPSTADWHPVSAFHILQKHWANWSRLREPAKKPVLDADGRWSTASLPPVPKKFEKIADTAADDISAILHNNLRLAHQLGDLYKVRIHAFFQPTMFSRRIHPDEVLGRYEHYEQPVRFQYRIRVQRRLDTLLDPSLIVSASKALDKLDVPGGLDWVHLNEAGARALAQFVFANTEATLREVAAAQRTGAPTP